MKLYSAAQVAHSLPYPKLIEALRIAFGQNIQTPLRTMHSIDRPTGGPPATFGLMPAWLAGEVLATKLITIFPDNASQGLPTIHAQIIVFDGKTGVPTAVVDGTEVTRRRTAAASALAASYLAHRHAEELLVVGTGPQAVHQALAHATVRPIRRIAIWGRSMHKARAVADQLTHGDAQFSVDAVDDLQAAVRSADIVSCVTSASEPLVLGAWLKPGALLDLVGSHWPERRECDDEAARRSRIYVDTRSGALAEAGDVLIPLRKGVIGPSDIIGDLHSLCRGESVGRRTPEEITFFKSVGSGLEDLTAAQLVATSLE